jgi:hypothetical protein
MNREEFRLKKLHGYEKNVPRCGNCTHLKSHNKPTGGVIHKCGQMGLVVARMACCDMWQSPKGEVLA